MRFASMVFAAMLPVVLMFFGVDGTHNGPWLSTQTQTSALG